MVDRHDLALARARVVLADIAPEIPDSEIVPDARLVDDLKLDLVSIWALATGLEKLAKVEILDADICSATTLGDLLAHALTEVPAGYLSADETGCADCVSTPSTPEEEPGGKEDEVASAETLESAIQDLAGLFKN
ncbi:hypothetical protein V3M78_09035 [Trueperella pyogenes]|uniref:hypothetical protein n=1 Tax=Trueperella pyogenes TaxID=1661 RepID=UPI00043AFFF0|nr:hypothetical protein [Trueperella pyogenes]AHU90376.1 hypothetical protein CQ11_01280 [Trueperella pyogenes]AZR00278.1 hypothetical protein EB776_02560 [Trueperella pyogenes]MDF2420835.1 hypothetical protein [Trueperella pyogenes]OQD39726.1 hypothetical protein B1R42_02295 [Trueperella pyogenes]